ncbi:hypothetical protein [Kribbella sp. CA-293567]|uniref:hypothetical protein n=1 Tax=Kribbella sp. CA-293567 TaxID=3002436 RepID=UPI0022DD48FE|nr:hypothetical protein [Kribbella sp. CA-293567]WBQ05754.1 hypothetical protein OX958_02870 [Kribbella sp. CA-293567]
MSALFLRRCRRLAVLLAVLAFLPSAPAQAAPPELPDQIAAAWRTDPLYVDPAMRAGFPQAELDRIKAAAASADFNVYVALIPRTPYLREERSLDLPTLLQARVGEPGLYLVWTVRDKYWSGVETMVRPAGLRGRSLVSVQLDDKQDNKIVNDRPAPKIVRTIQQASTAYDGRALPAIPATDLRQDTPRRTEPSTTDKEDRSVFVGMGIGGLIGFVLVLTLVLRRGRRRPATRRGGTATPVTGVRTQADRWIPKAGRAIRALEKQKSHTSLQLDLRDDARARLDAAKTLRAGGNDDVLALAGAYVLARQAFQVASSDDLLPPCFFDPTHPSGTVRAAWSDDTEVPACRTCAKTVEQGKTPRGLLVSRKSGLFGSDLVPYWTLDPEDNPMTATGFGALSDDLAERVTRVYGGVR